MRWSSEIGGVATLPDSGVVHCKMGWISVIARWRRATSLRDGDGAVSLYEGMEQRYCEIGSVSV